LGEAGDVGQRWQEEIICVGDFIKKSGRVCASLKTRGFGSPENIFFDLNELGVNAHKELNEFTDESGCQLTEYQRVMV